MIWAEIGKEIEDIVEVVSLSDKEEEEERGTSRGEECDVLEEVWERMCMDMYAHRRNNGLRVETIVLPALGLRQ